MGRRADGRADKQTDKRHEWPAIVGGAHNGQRKRRDTDGRRAAAATMARKCRRLPEREREFDNAPRRSLPGAGRETGDSFLCAKVMRASNQAATLNFARCRLVPAVRRWRAPPLSSGGSAALALAAAAAAADESP